MFDDRIPDWVVTLYFRVCVCVLWRVWYVYLWSMSTDLINGFIGVTTALSIHPVQPFRLKRLWPTNGFDLSFFKHSTWYKPYDLIDSSQLSWLLELFLTLEALHDSRSSSWFLKLLDDLRSTIPSSDISRIWKKKEPRQLSRRQNAKLSNWPQLPPLMQTPCIFLHSIRIHCECFE